MYRRLCRKEEEKYDEAMFIEKFRYDNVTPSPIRGFSASSLLTFRARQHFIEGQAHLLCPVGAAHPRMPVASLPIVKTTNHPPIKSSLLFCIKF